MDPEPPDQARQREHHAQRRWSLTHKRLKSTEHGPLPVVLRPPSVDKLDADALLMSLSAGCTFTKFGRRGNSAKRRVFLNQEQSRIQWVSNKKDEAANCIQLSDIVDIVPGQHLGTGFRRLSKLSKYTSDAAQRCCFSIRYRLPNDAAAAVQGDSNSRSENSSTSHAYGSSAVASDDVDASFFHTLDLMAPDTFIADVWIAALNQLLKRRADEQDKQNKDEPEQEQAQEQEKTKEAKQSQQQHQAAASDHQNDQSVDAANGEQLLPAVESLMLDMKRGCEFGWKVFPLSEHGSSSDTGYDGLMGVFHLTEDMTAVSWLDEEQHQPCVSHYQQHSQTYTPPYPQLHHQHQHQYQHQHQQHPHHHPPHHVRAATPTMGMSHRGHGESISVTASVCAPSYSLQPTPVSPMMVERRLDIATIKELVLEEIDGLEESAVDDHRSNNPEQECKEPVGYVGTIRCIYVEQMIDPSLPDTSSPVEVDCVFLLSSTNRDAVRTWHSGLRALVTEWRKKNTQVQEREVHDVDQHEGRIRIQQRREDGMDVDVASSDHPADLIPPSQPTPVPNDIYFLLHHFLSPSSTPDQHSQSLQSLISLVNSAAASSDVSELVEVHRILFEPHSSMLAHALRGSVDHLLAIRALHALELLETACPSLRWLVPFGCGGSGSRNGNGQGSGSKSSTHLNLSYFPSWASSSDAMQHWVKTHLIDPMPRWTRKPRDPVKGFKSLFMSRSEKTALVMQLKSNTSRLALMRYNRIKLLLRSFATRKKQGENSNAPSAPGGKKKSSSSSMSHDPSKEIYQEEFLKLYENGAYDPQVVRIPEVEESSDEDVNGGDKQNAAKLRQPERQPSGCKVRSPASQQNDAPHSARLTPPRDAAAPSNPISTPSQPASSSDAAPSMDPLAGDVDRFQSIMESHTSVAAGLIDACNSIGIQTETISSAVLDDIHSLLTYCHEASLAIAQTMNVISSASNSDGCNPEDETPDWLHEEHGRRLMDVSEALHQALQAHAMWQRRRQALDARRRISVRGSQNGHSRQPSQSHSISHANLTGEHSVTTASRRRRKPSTTADTGVAHAPAGAAVVGMAASRSMMGGVALAGSIVGGFAKRKSATSRPSRSTRHQSYSSHAFALAAASAPVGGDHAHHHAATAHPITYDQQPSRVYAAESSQSRSVAMYAQHQHHDASGMEGE